MSDYLQALSADVAAEISRADNKAALLLAGGGVIVGSGTSTLVAEAPKLSGITPLLAVPLCVAAISALAALVTLGVAAYPRGVRGGSLPAGQIMYFGDIVQYEDSLGLRKAIQDSFYSKEEMVLMRLILLSRIVQVKYWFIRLSFFFFALTLTAAVSDAVMVLIGV